MPASPQPDFWWWGLESQHVSLSFSLLGGSFTSTRVLKVFVFSKFLLFKRRLSSFLFSSFLFSPSLRRWENVESFLLHFVLCSHRPSSSTHSVPILVTFLPTLLILWHYRRFSTLYTSSWIRRSGLESH